MPAAALGGERGAVHRPGAFEQHDARRYCRSGLPLRIAREKCKGLGSECACSEEHADSLGARLGPRSVTPGQRIGISEKQAECAGTVPTSFCGVCERSGPPIPRANGTAPVTFYRPTFRWLLL